MHLWDTVRRGHEWRCGSLIILRHSSTNGGVWFGLWRDNILIDSASTLMKATKQAEDVAE